MSLRICGCVQRGLGCMWRVTYCSRVQAEATRSATLRERGCAILQMMTGTISVYRQAKTMEGATSSALGAPPIGAENVKVKVGGVDMG